MASIKRRADGVYRARYRDPAGRERVRHFARKTHAQRWLDEAITAIVTGTWVDPTGGRVTFSDYARSWQPSQVHRRNTALAVDSALRVHPSPRSATGRSRASAGPRSRRS